MLPEPPINVLHESEITNYRGSLPAVSLSCISPRTTAFLVMTKYVGSAGSLSKFGHDQISSLRHLLYKFARRLNEGKYEPVTVERIAALSKRIDLHTELVSNAIRASLERWNIE